MKKSLLYLISKEYNNINLEDNIFTFDEKSIIIAL